MRSLQRLDNALVVIAACALVLMMSLTTISVFGRYFFNTPIPDDLIISEVLMVFVAFLPLAYVQSKKEHVFVTVFTDWMSTPAKVVMETIGTLIGMFIFSVVAAAVFTDFLEVWASGAYYEGPLKIPEWPGKFIVALGLALFALRLVIDAIVSVIGLMNGTAVAARSEVELVLEKKT